MDKFRTVHGKQQSATVVQRSFRLVGSMACFVILTTPTHTRARDVQNFSFADEGLGLRCKGSFIVCSDGDVNKMFYMSFIGGLFRYYG